ncbi:MAG: isoprenylcysteine carboxylmethyltransferase family protein [Bacteriovoracaceae bacterium]
MSKNRPASAISIWDGLLGLLAFLLSCFVIKFYSIESPLNASVLALLATASAMIFSTFKISKVHLEPDFHFDFKLNNSISWPRIFKQLGSLYLIYALALVCYLNLPEYQKDMYLPFGRLIYRIWPLLLFLPIPYFFFCLRFQKNVQKKDDYELLFDMITTFKRPADWKVSQFLLGWVVKCFYFPLMFVALSEKMSILILTKSLTPLSVANFFYLAYHTLFAIDVVLVSVGYLFAFKLLHSHIRSVENTFIGWLATIICYLPFWTFIERWYFHYYSEGPAWWQWLEGHWAYIPWAIAIIGLLFVYTFSTVAFGLRFSNLTHRGIITHGPYRFLKHPAYMSKCLAWLFISIPFVPFDGAPSPWLRTFTLITLWGVYYVRAKTEERHLSRDPIYQQYLGSFKKSA